MSKKRFFSVLLVASMLMGLFSLQPAFAQPSDIAGHWAESQISDWLNKGLVSGYPDGTFKPDGNITRAEFVTIVNNAFGFNQSAPDSFTDVKSGDWFAGQVSAARAAGYVSGYEDGTFRPDNRISRQEAAVMLANVLKLSTVDNTSAVGGFTDADTIPQWSSGAINAVVAKGCMSGYPDRTFLPDRPITRAEAISTMDRALKTTTGSGVSEPSVVTEAYATNSSTITLTMDKALTGGSSEGANGFTVGGTLANDPVAVTNVAVDGTSVVLTVDKDLTADDTISLSYDNTKATVKLTGNDGDVASFTGQAVDNALDSAAAPAVVTSAAKTDSNTITLTMDKALTGGSSEGANGFTVGGELANDPVAVTDVAVDGTSVVLTVDKELTADDTISLSYDSAQATAKLTGNDGDVASFTGLEVNGASGSADRTAEDVAAEIIAAVGPDQDATSISLPQVPDGFTIAIKSSSNTGVIAGDGTITPPETDTLVDLVFTVTRTSDGTSADTDAVTVLVPARS